MKIYKCSKCGKIMVVLKNGAPDTICCDTPMEELTPHMCGAELSDEHIPVTCTKCGKLYVRIGKVEHPQHKSHNIEWIIMETKKGFEITYLSVTDKPIACFKISKCCPPLAVYVYCNVHGLWKKEIDL